MIDKIRLLKDGKLHPDLHENLGKGFDQRCCTFFGVSYENLREKALTGLSDEDLLSWARENGATRTEEDMEIWNEFLRKRGWNDEASELLARRIRESGFESRNDILTMFDYLDADEGRM